VICIGLVIGIGSTGRLETSTMGEHQEEESEAKRRSDDVYMKTPADIGFVTKV